MSEENVEFARQAAALANTGDLEAIAELFHPDAEARDLQHAPDTPEVLRGRAAIVAVWEQWLEALDDWTIEVSEYVDVHPWVVCATRWHATGKGSGVAIDWALADAYEIEHGKIVRAIFGYPDVAAALEALQDLPGT
jgi:ketosteroid isomerase-like protein